MGERNRMWGLCVLGTVVYEEALVATDANGST